MRLSVLVVAHPALTMERPHLAGLLSVGLVIPAVTAVAVFLVPAEAAEAARRAIMVWGATVAMVPLALIMPLAVAEAVTAAVRSAATALATLLAAPAATLPHLTAVAPAAHRAFLAERARAEAAAISEVLRAAVAVREELGVLRMVPAEAEAAEVKAKPAGSAVFMEVAEEAEVFLQQVITEPKASSSSRTHTFEYRLNKAIF